MDYVFLIASSAIFLTCFYFIASPFFSKGKNIKEEMKVVEEMTTLEDVYRATNELEMDYLMKKIKETDFLYLKEQYQLLAVDLMKRKNRINTSQADKKSIELAELEILGELKKIRKQGES